MDEVLPYVVPDLVLLIFGIGGTLGLTWAIENGIEWGETPTDRRLIQRARARNRPSVVGDGIEGLTPPLDWKR
jgi:hypothetical protein